MQNSKIKPFLRWAGGKNWLVPYIHRIVPSQYNRYFEPFLGGGSVFFALTPKKATLSDANEELINLYRIMRDHPKQLREHLVFHNHNHNKEYYYQVRLSQPSSQIERAARLLYLNRTCFNGLYRVNKSGNFNVPIGNKNECLKEIDRFEMYSQVLHEIIIECCDFEHALDSVREKDLVFADPPYVTKHNSSSFSKYTDKLFSWDDQERLCRSLQSARDRGAFIVSTNCDVPAIIDLYMDNGFFCSQTEHICCISGSTNRNVSKELLITSFPQDRQRGDRYGKNSIN